MITQLGSIHGLRESIAQARHRLEEHPLYGEIRTIEQLRVFLQSHVFAVWDFMSLLKSLQASLTCVSTPWVPSAFPQSRRLVNEIVLGEESDSFDAGYLSHFELYLRAMKEAGADATAIEGLIRELNAGRSLTHALLMAEPPKEALEFVRATFSFIDSRKAHVVAAAFTFGREDLIPDMFRQMIKSQQSAGLLQYYFDRHIEVDGDSHGPMALQMVEELCGEDAQTWDEATVAAQAAIQARIALWDGILARIRQLD